MELTAEGRPRVYITKGIDDAPKPDDASSGDDPFAKHFGDAPPPQRLQIYPASENASTYDQAFSDKPPAEDKLPAREVGKSESAVKGLGNALTFGTSPAIAGLAEASGIPSDTKPGEDGIDLNPVRPIVGAAKLLHNYFSDHPDPEVQAAYDRGRRSQLNDEQLAQEQHPAVYLAGQLGGALLTPLGMTGNAVTAGGKITAGALAGTVGGGLYGAGDAIGRGEDPLTVAKEGGKGALTGAAFGTAASAGGHVIGQGVDKVLSIARGTRDVDAEAGRRVVDAIRSDIESNGPAMSRGDIAAANAAGTPRAIVDTGGERTRALARSAANTSPEGRQALTEVTQNRFEDQAPRIGGFIRKITGGSNADADSMALQEAAQAANKPAYARVFAANPVVQVPTEITSRPAVAQAMKDAISLAKNYGEKMEGAPELRTILSGPGYHIADEVANPAQTSLKYWDYVKKAIDARINGLKRTGGISDLNSKEKADLAGLIDAKNALVNHLDKAASGYQDVRRGAAAFFGAEDALEAGQKFVMSNANIHEARRALAKMNPAERELFARGFASDLADKIERTGDNRNVLNSIFLNNGPARQKINLALGPERASQLEALLRAEHVIDQARKALGNSSTARQLAEAGLAGGGAVAAFEGLKEHDFNPMHVLTAALTFGALKHGAKVIDSRVARRVGEMLASNDPAILAKGVKVVSKTPVMMDALRRATAAGVRIGAQDIGFDNSVAGAATLGQRVLRGPDPEAPDHTPENPYDLPQ